MSKANAKPWYQSRTIVLNGLVAIIAALIAAVTELQKAGSEWTGPAVLGAILAGLNVLLRLSTESAIQPITGPPRT